MLLGPLFGLALVGLAIVGNSGPGFFVFSLAAAVGFVVVVPAIQLALRGTPRFKHRPGAACAIALGIVSVALLAISGASTFNQW